MDLILALKAVILGIVEGLTEFLPVSSTGHLILASELLHFLDQERRDIFNIVIQFGAILAVCWEFRPRIAKVLKGIASERTQQRFVLNVIVATVPAVVLGLLLNKQIKAHLFNPLTVALALVIGGLVILLAEWREARAAMTAPGIVPNHARDALPRGPHAQPARINTIDDLSVLDALKVGIAQCFALIPGTSRSGATIIGGMLFGIPRLVATEFSFFLAIPVIFGATVYELYKARHDFHSDDLGLIGIGFVFAFISAFICVRWLLRFIATHDFKGFAWYRIVFGLLILASAWTGWINWSA